MGNQKKYLIVLLMLMQIYCFTPVVTGQQNSATEIDTSGYISSLIEDALNYNLIIAASKGYTSEVTRLINLGADINATTEEGVSALMFAILNNHPDAVNTILSFNPALDNQTLTSETPLIMAVKNNLPNITEALIRAGADIDLPDRNGATPLHYATINGYFDLTDLLLYYKASIDEKSDDGTTPLLAAISAGFADVSDLLIQNGANMEARNKDGNTPFLMAAVNGDTLIMDLLQKNGVDIYSFNNAHYTALDIAISANQTTAVKYLLKKGDKWSEMKGKSVDPYRVAEKYRRREMIWMLKDHNVPGQLKYSIDQMAFSLTARFTAKDIYTGLAVSFKEPYINGGIVAGCDMKIWYTRVLSRQSENIYYQYWDKGYFVYAGLFKDFPVYENPFGSNITVSGSLLGGYSFGHTLKGTYFAPEDAFKMVPALALKWNFRNITSSLGAEYNKTQFYHNGPVWFRAGFSYTLFLDKVRTQIKPIKWY
jgi:ankyrin repeat protein